MKNLRIKFCGFVLTAAIPLMAAATPSYAVNVAVFGSNDIFTIIDNHYGDKSATLVTDADLSTPGFLDSFDAFVYTRNDAAFAVSLSSAAAANVKSFVGSTGNFVVFNGDFADHAATDAKTGTLFDNALDFVTPGGHGFISELGTAAFTSNANGLTPLGLIAGDAGVTGNNQGLSNQSVAVAPGGAGHPVLTGVNFPFNPAYVEFGAALSGVDQSLVVASFVGLDGSSNPAILARGDFVPNLTPSAVANPEPLTAGLSLLSLAGLGLAALRRRQA